MSNGDGDAETAHASAWLTVSRAIADGTLGEALALHAEVRRAVVALGTALTQLQANSPALPSRSAERSAQKFLAFMRLDDFSQLRNALGAQAARASMMALRDHITSSHPGATMRRIGHGVLEFQFSSPSRAMARQELEDLHDALGSTNLMEELPHFRGFRFGYTELGAVEHLDDAVFRAERALETATAAGAPCSYFGDAHSDEALERAALVADLRAALQANRLTLAYQPKVNLRTGRIDGVEALARWCDPLRGPIAPDVFVRLAEETGDIAALTRTVLHMSLCDHAHLSREGLSLPIYVNLSGRLVADDAFCDELLTLAGASPDAFGLEVTETAAFADPDRALANLKRLAEAGVTISIDDYGSGLSSLVYLKSLPARELKIDRVFVSGLTSSHRNPLIVRSTIDLAHALEMEVTAEGVEDAGTLALLRSMGCDRAQGYLISPPLPLEGLEAFLRDNADRDLTALASGLFASLKARPHP